MPKDQSSISRGRQFPLRARRGDAHGEVFCLWRCKFLLTRIAVTLIALVAAGGSQAITIDPSESVGAVPGAPGTGLLATYTSLTSVPATLAAAMQAAAVGSPSATYVASMICFPACGATERDGNSLASYVAANGVSLVGSATLGPSYSSYIGYLAINAPGTYHYNLTSDDGSELLIGGQTIIDMGGQQTWTDLSAAVTFASAGLYPIEVDQFDAGGYTGITLTQNWAALSPSSLYAAPPSQPVVPEPASLISFMTGVLALGALRRRVRAAARA